MCNITEILNGYPKKHKITIEELADLLGYDCHQTLGRHLNHNDHQRPFPVSKLIPIIKACNNDFTVLDHIESRLGRVAFHLPKEGEVFDHEMVATIVEISGKACTEAVKSIADNVIDEGERERLTHVFTEQIQLLSRAIGIINKHHAAPTQDHSTTSKHD